MRRLLFFMLGLLFTCTQILAQNRTVSGVITDSVGQAIPGVSVRAVQTKGGTATDAKGYFKLNVPSAAHSLEISSVGYVSQIVPIPASNVINVTLKSNSSSLGEVVVVGYGTAKRTTEIPGSISTVKGTVVQDKPVANMLDELQGKVSGLQIYTSSGEPTTTPSIRLNGSGSLTSGTTPLFIMDGIPIDPGTVLSLNPADFEDITVLKDAASTSIYGSRAANGVILFTSKKGRLNSSKITVDAQYGVSNFTNNTLNVYNSMMNAAQYKSFVVAAGLKTQSQLDATLASLPYKNADTRWYKVFYRENAPTYSLNMNVSGGSGKTTYYVSGSYFNQEGLAWRSAYNRYTLRSNLNTTVNSWFQMGLNLIGGYDERQGNPYGSNQLNRGLSELIAPYYSNKDANGVEYPALMAGSQRYNPKYLAQEFPSVSNNLQLNPTAYVQLTPARGLTLKSTGGIEFYDYRTTSDQLPSYAGAPNAGTVSESFSRGSTRTITNTAEYKFSLAQHHNITALAGQEYIDYTGTSFGASNNKFTDDRTLYLQQGSTSGFSATSSEDQYAYLSYFGRLDYNFDTKYFLSLTTRYDQSSKFGRNVRGATFYSVGTSWSAKKESFLSDVNWLNDLIVKASIGTTGNSSGINDYDALPITSTLTAYNGSTAWTVAQPGNAELTWEKQRQINVGFQTTIFKRFHIDAEYFDRLTTSMLFNVPYPYTSGFSSVETNVGGLSNKGVNATVNIDVISKKNGFLSVYANAGYVNEKVTELFQGKQYWTLPNTGVTYAVGQAVSFYEPIFAEIDPATGHPLWYVPNADPNKFIYTNKDPKNVTSTFNGTTLLQNTGIKLEAPYNGGFGLNGGFKGITVAADFTFSADKYLLNNDEYFYNNPTLFGSSYNQSIDVLDYWKKPGDVTRYPRITDQFTQFDSRLIENASFIRLKNLTVAYNLPKSLVTRTRAMSAVKVYVTFRNLLTFTKYPGPDPEVDSNLSLGVNPNTKQSVAGITVTF